MSSTDINEIIFITNPAILTMAVIENNEPMMDLKNQQEVIFGSSPEIPDNRDYTKMRKSVYEKLKQAQASLPTGLRFCIYEAYRSISLQKMLFDARFEKISKLHPHWSYEDIFTETTRLVSPVINLDGSANIPPHSTGGAVDLYLIDETGEPVDMGIHPKDWMDDEDGSLSITSSEIISLEAKKNRKILNSVMSAVGFVNYPTEFWHWSYGDRYWAYHMKMSHAIYDSMASC